MDRQRSVLETDTAEAAAVRAGLLAPQAMGLLLEEDRQRALVQAVGGGSCDLFQGGQIDAEVGSVLTEGASSNDFSPAGGQRVDLVEFVRSAFTLRHLQFFLALASSAEGAFPLSL